jgi:hypothetical protein
MAPPVDQRADLDALLEAIADLHRAHFVGEFFGEGIVHLVVHIEAVRGGTGLAHVAHLGDDRARHSGLDIGILEDDERRVSAEFHRRDQNIVRRLFQKLSSHLRRAGEGDDTRAVVMQ